MTLSCKKTGFLFLLFSLPFLYTINNIFMILIVVNLQYQPGCKKLRLSVDDSYVEHHIPINYSQFISFD